MSSISLRALEMDDLDALYDIENDIDVLTEGISTTPYSREMLRQYIALNQSDLYADRQLRLAISDEGGDVLGLVDLTDFEPKHNRAQLGIVVRRMYRRSGIGSEAIRLLKDYARRVAHLHQLYCIISASNEASICMARAVGFEEKATLREWIFDGHEYKDALLLQLFL